MINLLPFGAHCTLTSLWRGQTTHRLLRFKTYLYLKQLPCSCLVIRTWDRACVRPTVNARDPVFTNDTFLIKTDLNRSKVSLTDHYVLDWLYLHKDLPASHLFYNSKCYSEDQTPIPIFFIILLHNWIDVDIQNLYKNYFHVFCKQLSRVNRLTNHMCLVGVRLKFTWAMFMTANGP